MNNSRNSLKLALAATLASAALAWSASTLAGGHHPPPPPPQGTPVSYSGDAQVVDVDLLLLKGSQLETPITVDLVKVGPLPPSGGFQHEHLLAIGDPAAQQLLLTAELAHALTAGNGFHANSEAYVANVDLGLGPVNPDALRITASVLQADTRADCKRGGGVDLSGSSAIASLVINGKEYAVTGEPNQTITIPNVATIIVNEQSSSSTATSGDITVNALHVILTPAPSPLAQVLTGDVIISHAHSDISGCPSTPPPCEQTNSCPPCEQTGTCPPCAMKDFITGGGYVLKDGEKVTFSTVGGFDHDGNLRNGHLNVVDHSAGGPHIQDSGFFNYTTTPGTTRVLQFFCNYGNGVCTVTVADNGEPGNAPKGDDTWQLESSGAASYGSTVTPIEGGNIQLHKPRGCDADPNFNPDGKPGKKH